MKFEKLTITNNGDDTYSLFVSDFIDRKTLNKYDVSANKLKGLNLDISLRREQLSNWGNFYTTRGELRLNAEVLKDEREVCYEMKLKEEKVKSYNDVMKYLKEGKELIFTSPRGTQQRFRVSGGMLQNFKGSKWEDRLYLPNWSDLSEGEWSVVL